MLGGTCPCKGVLRLLWGSVFTGVCMLRFWVDERSMGWLWIGVFRLGICYMYGMDGNCDGILTAMGGLDG